MLPNLLKIDPLKLVLRLIHCTGALHLGRAGSLVYKCYTYFMATCAILHVVCQVAALWPTGDEDSDSMAQMTLVTCVILTTVTAVVKFFTFTTHAETLRTMVREIEALPSTPLDAECKRRSIVLVLSILIAGNSTVISWILEPIFEGRREVPVPLKLPFDIVNSGGSYAAVILAQGALLLVMGLMHYSVDALCCIIIVILCTHLRDVAFEIENSVMYSTPFPIFLPTEDGRERLLQLSNIFEEFPISYEDNIGKVKQCVKRHQALVRIANLLESSMNIIIFCQSFACLFVTCIVSYQMTTHVENVAVHVKMAIYLMTVLIQLFVYSWFGSELMTESEGLGFSLYNSAWNEIPSRSNELRNLLIMAIMRSQRPLAITCGKFMPMSRTLFLKFLSHSYSFFTVLRIIDQDR